MLPGRPRSDPPRRAGPRAAPRPGSGTTRPAGCTSRPSADSESRQLLRRPARGPRPGRAVARCVVRSSAHRTASLACRQVGDGGRRRATAGRQARAGAASTGSQLTASLPSSTVGRRAGTSRPRGRAARVRRTACCATARPGRCRRPPGRTPGRRAPRWRAPPPRAGGRGPSSRPIRAGASDIRSATPAQSMQAGVDHRLLHDRQRGLQAEHAERGGLPLAVLVLVRVRRVVGGDDVDGAVGQPVAQRLDVGGRAQRRVDLVDRVVRRGELVGQQQVVRARPRR